MGTLVMKFGGTSTGSEEALKRAADIVGEQASKWDRIVVVVSAMEGVTDMLIEIGERAISRDRGSFESIINELHHKLISIAGTVSTSQGPLLELIDARIAELTQICQHIQKSRDASQQELAQIAALGERINVHIFSAALRDRDLRSEPIDAADLIVTDDCYQSATPIKEITDNRINAGLSPLLAEGIIPVVTGFIGSTISGETTTLGRGGSDYSAAILAEGIKADEIWIWTDVDGVMTADPGLISGARLIPEISYNEVFQLAYSGAEVVHPKTILPAREANIPLFVRNTFNLECSGTRISDCSSSVSNTISAVTGYFKIKTITFELKPGGDVYKIKTLMLAVLKLHDIIPLAIFNSNHHRSISFAIPVNNMEDVVQAIRSSSIIQSFDDTFSRTQVNGDLSIITLVGRDIYLSPQVLPKVSNTLEESGVDIKHIGNGTSPDSIVFAVENQSGKKAIRQIHDRIILNGNSHTPRTEPVLRHQPAV
jgi:aspartate kinase